MKKETISVRFHIKLEEIENLLYSAAQGSSYWSTNSSELGYQTVVAAVLDKDNKRPFFLKDDEDEAGKEHELNLKRIKRGLTVLSKKYFHHINDIVNGEADMYTADALVQCAIFGDIIYS